MYRFSNTSAERLHSCDERIQQVFTGVIQHWDCTIIEGHRNLRRQHDLFLAGRSKIDGVSRKGNHNYRPSRAVDAAPYDNGHAIFNDVDLIIRFANFVIGYAACLGIKIRWGGDWDSDRDRKDQSFNDLVHFEVVEED